MLGFNRVELFVIGRGSWLAGCGLRGPGRRNVNQSALTARSSELDSRSGVETKGFCRCVLPVNEAG